jgi:flavodoxin
MIGPWSVRAATKDRSAKEVTMKATVLYFSSSGKTGALAARLSEELRRRGCKVLSTSLDEARRSDLAQCDAVFIGSPAWSGEQVTPALDEFVRGHVERLAGARVAMFGSYDWGEGRYFEALGEYLRSQAVAVHDRPLVSRQTDPELTDEVVTEFVAEVLAEAGRPES